MKNRSKERYFPVHFQISNKKFNKWLLLIVLCYKISFVGKWLNKCFIRCMTPHSINITVSSVIPISPFQINNYSEFWRQRFPRMDSIHKNGWSRMETVSSVRCHGLNGMNQKSFELQNEGHIDGKNNALKDIRKSEHTIVNQKLRRKKTTRKTNLSFV